ncbi:hypothetical protein RP20_CCG020796 [Aedes albopictus]|nr:hypothetical protein RP20_CCG020796 [Aedes albopictus]
MPPDHDPHPNGPKTLQDGILLLGAGPHESHEVAGGLCRLRPPQLLVLAGEVEGDVAFTSLTPSLLEARPEPPIRGGGGGPGGPYPPSRPEPPNGGYSYGPPALPPSISVNSYGSATSEYGPPSQAPIIHKHVYVHVPPPEDEVPTTRKPITVPPPQKHYKIVFIKAPSPPSQAPPVIPPLPQNEEKTLVYVLVKKQEEQPDIVIPTPAPTPPSKPEVYFIRYKTQVTSHRSHRPPNLSKLLILNRMGTPEVHIRRAARPAEASVALSRLSAESTERRRVKLPATAMVYHYRSVLSEYIYHKFLKLFSLKAGVVAATV